jgi:hypothetical protein
MTQEQYDKLKPYRDLLMMWHKDKVLVSATGLDTMHAVFVEMGNSPRATYCSSCKAEIYNYLANQIVRYETNLV